MTAVTSRFSVGITNSVSAMAAAAFFAVIPLALAEESPFVVTGKNRQTNQYLVGSAESKDSAPSVRLEDGQELMLWVKLSNVAVSVQGPAEFKIVKDSDQIKLFLESGRRLLITAGTAEDDLPFLITAGGDPEEPYFKMEAPVGTTVIARSLAHDSNQFYFDIARVDGEGSVEFRLREDEEKLNVGEHIAIRNGTISRGEASAWVSDANVARTATSNLSFGAAISGRGKVCESLVYSLASWDRTAQSNPVALLPPKVDRFRTEERTINTQISVPAAANQSGQNRPGPINFKGANEVPVASPAAIAVGGSNAAAANNAQARSLLTITDSRGLGFGGLSLLGIRGTTAGVPFTGPAGLGGR